MHTETRDGSQERRILIGLVTDSQFLSRVAPRWDKEGLFASRWSNLIGGWCVKHCKKYGKAPGKAIQTVFETWKESTSETRKMVERFLASLSDEFEKEQELTTEHLIDLAQEYFNQVRLERMQEEIKLYTERGEVEEAIEARENFRKIELKTPLGVDVLRDEAAQKHSLESKQRVLVYYPGPAGAFFGEELAEDSLVAFMAPPKGGKSFTLLDIAWRGMRQGCKVAYFQVGDMSQDQIMRRFLKRAARRPIGKGIVYYPLGIVLSGNYKEPPIVEREDRTYDTPLGWNKARLAFLGVAKKSKGNLRLSYHPIRTISISGIRSILEGWDREGYESNLVVIDYPENLAPTNPKASLVEQIGETWALLRQLSELRKSCVVVGQQTNKEGFHTWCLTRNHFRGNLMILAHVTAFLGINQTEEERSQEIIRYNFVVRREDKFSETKCLYTASCLAIANPCVISCFP